MIQFNQARVFYRLPEKGIEQSIIADRSYINTIMSLRSFKRNQKIIMLGLVQGRKRILRKMPREQEISRSRRRANQHVKKVSQLHTDPEFRGSEWFHQK